MSSESKKHEDFVSGPMGEKSVSELAGIGPVLAEKLTKKGYDKAHKLLGQFLLLDKEEARFQQWLKDTIEANAKQAGDCSKCMKAWCEANL